MLSIPCTGTQVAPLGICKQLITDDVLYAKIPKHLGRDDTPTPCQLLHVKSSRTADRATFILVLLVLCALELGEAHAFVGADMLLILLCFRTPHNFPQYVKRRWVQVALPQGLSIPPADTRDAASMNKQKPKRNRSFTIAMGMQITHGITCQSASEGSGICCASQSKQEWEAHIANGPSSDMLASHNSQMAACSDYTRNRTVLTSIPYGPLCA